MTAPRLADYLSHMLTAAREAREFVGDETRDQFLADRRTQRAVVMNLLILGEAAARIMDAHGDFASSHPEIEWRAMRGMRNRMAHGYFETDHALVWETVTRALPSLISALETVTGQDS